MNDNYMKFIIGYDCGKELEKLDLACDEAYDFCEYVIKKYKDYILKNDLEDYYETFNGFLFYEFDFEREYIMYKQ